MGESTAKSPVEAMQQAAEEAAQVEETVPADAPEPVLKKAPAEDCRHPTRGTFMLLIGIAAAVPSLIVFCVMAYQASVKRQESSEELRQTLQTLNEKLTAIQEETRGKRVEITTAASHETFSSLMAEAHISFHNRDYGSAAETYQEAIAADETKTKSDEAHYHLGVCMNRMNDPEHAMEEFLTVVSVFPGSEFFARSALEAARMQMERQHFGQARRLLYQLLGAKDRYKGEEEDCIEEACFLLAGCLEGEAAVIEASRYTAAAEALEEGGKMQ